ncbi:MAG: hypothetical protein JXL97_00185 [Bacteroidales bacterium]|nr:hypothetical protein [Bacteroidales bacterium]
MKFFKILIILFVFLPGFLLSQEYNYHDNNDFKEVVMMNLNFSDSIVHTAFFPLRVSYCEQIIGKENLFYNSKRTDFANKLPISWFWRKFLSEEFLVFKENNIEFSISPLFNYYNTNAKGDSNFYGQNTRGFEVKGTLGKKLSFYTDFFETQAYFLPYIDQVVVEDFIVPGQGSWKLFGDDQRGRDYNYASGYFSYAPADFFNFQAGHSKQFVGSGYRSMLLSDNSYVYPFAKFTFTKGKWQYIAMFTEFQSFKTKNYFYHYKKHGSFTFLNYSPFSNFEIGLFEGIIWQTSDDSTYVKNIPALYFVPVPFLREAVYGFDSEQNIILGLNTRIKVYKFGEFYGQFALNQFSVEDFNKRYSYQFGVKIYDVFAQKINGQRLFILAEYNYAKPYSYTHELNHQAYTHYNAPLAHPLGAGFSEFVGIANWNAYGFKLSYKLNIVKTATDTLGSNFGSDLLLTNNSANFENTFNFVGQGNQTYITSHNLELAYVVNPVTNIQLFVSVGKRNYLSEIAKDDLFFVSFGIKNAIKNFYYDF